jgi:hypothetical protein
MEGGEPVSQGGGDASEQEPEEEKSEPCKRIYLHAFGGERDHQFVRDFKAKLSAEKQGSGPGPSIMEVLIWSGHVGVSFEAASPIYGFNPKVEAGAKTFAIVEQLKERQVPFPGTVSDDTDVFNAARQRGLKVVTIEYVYPESKYQELKAKFDAERGSCQYKYSFPGGGGDCNCATFPALVGLPVPRNGNMRDYMPIVEAMPTPQKKGKCDG